jgi:hypothetical protein
MISLALLVAACSTTGTGDSGPRRNRNLITAEELAELDGVNSVYDAVRRLRANWLSGRGANRPRVFVDGVDLGGTGVLQNYRIDTVRELRFVAPADATLRFGTGFGGGVIEVTTR